MLILKDRGWISNALFLTGSGLPISPVQVQSTVTTTTANISWTASVLSCLPENYTVIFFGLELQPEVKEAELVFGATTNALAPNRAYFALLEELEEANTYNYTIQTINYNGVTLADVMQFTTMPDCEHSLSLHVTIIH